VSFPRKLLAPGEEIVVESFPNWSVLARPITLTIFTIAACVAILVYWTSAPIWLLYLFGIVAALAFCWLAGKVIAWRSRLLVITTNRVIYRWGIVRRTGREIPLERVQDVTYHQTLLERLVGAGSLTIESAGATGQEPFPDIRHPAEMQSLINRLVAGDREPYRQAAKAGREPIPAPARAPEPRLPQPQQPPPPTPTQQVDVTPVFPPAGGPATSPMAAAPGGRLGEQLRDLERLHELGVITDDEFDRKRRELLGLD
jgi:membrane protein YdbS with pleckstrin-like domain